MRNGARRLGWKPWLVLCCALAVGCQGVSVWRVASRPRVVRSAPGDFATGAPVPGSLLDEARASHALAINSSRASRELAAQYELAAISQASTFLASRPAANGPGGPMGPEAAEAVALYDAALEGLLRSTGDGRAIRPGNGWDDRLAALGVQLVGPAPGIDAQSTWDPDRFDQLLFASDLQVRGMERSYRADGLGVPMLAIRRFEPDKRRRATGQDRYLMPREVYPVTAILRMSPGAGAAPGYQLELRDPLVARQDDPALLDVPLAMDLTTPLAYHFARSPLPILQEVGLLDPGWLEGLQGLYMLQPYRPGRIPIVFIHGLRSSPLAWLKDINEVWGDPMLRERYQVWIYMYPTGKPVFSTAATLRQDLDALRRTIDPGHGDPTLDRMVLVGHSMGGLLAKMMLLESGDAVWRLYSNRPLDQIRVAPDQRETLRQVFFFHPVPSVARVVFIATPHRGSALGDQWIGRVTGLLIRLPRTLRSAYRNLLAVNDSDTFTPLMRERKPSSIEELRLDNPLLTTLARLPRRVEVPAHSIIGRRDPDDPVEDSSDGVVPYSSSHIDWAESERVVPGNHMCQDVPETLGELVRILRLHLGEPGLPPM